MPHSGKENFLQVQAERWRAHMKTQSNLKGTKGTMYFLSVVVYFYNKLTNIYIEVFCIGFSCIIIKGNINYGIKYNCLNHKQCHQIPVPVNMYFTFIDNSTITASCLKKYMMEQVLQIWMEEDPRSVRNFSEEGQGFSWDAWHISEVTTSKRSSNITFKILLKAQRICQQQTLHMSLLFLVSTLISISSFQLAQKPLYCGQFGRYMQQVPTGNQFGLSERKTNKHTKNIWKSKWFGIGWTHRKWRVFSVSLCHVFWRLQGAAFGDITQVSFPVDLQGSCIPTAWILWDTG